MSAMGSGSISLRKAYSSSAPRNGARRRCKSMLSSVDCNAASLGVATDTGVKEIKDLKGKRVGFVVGSPALNQNALPILAFGGLKQSDVKVVEFAGYGAMWKGIVNNDTDAAFGTTITGPAKEPRPRRADRLAAAARQRQGGLGARQEGRFVLLPAHCDLRRRHLKGQADRARQLSLPDLRRLRIAAGGRGLCDLQGDDRRLRRLQGCRPGASGLAGRPADQELGGADAFGRRQGAEGSGPWSDDQEATTTAC